MLYIAFLRAINVGGHKVKMDVLRGHFEALGFENVATFIASGNVIFDADSDDAAALETQIAEHLEDCLGYEVATFLRTPAEVAAVASYEPFSAEATAEAGALGVAFVASPLSAAEKEILTDLESDVDTFHTHGREVYWLCRVKQSESKFSNAVFERRLKRQATFRGIKTVARLAAKYPAS